MPKPRPSDDRRSGIRARLTVPERERLEAGADAAGLTLSAYVRRVVLAAPVGRRGKRPPEAKAELARLLAQIGKIGSNLNQLAHAANAGAGVDGALLAAELGELEAVRTAIRAALGREVSA
ncbi:MAG: plasmid mobilization protein [Desulfuromonadaceae bacterium]